MSDNNSVAINFPDKPAQVQIHINNSNISAIIGSCNQDIEMSINDSAICLICRNEAGGGGKDV